jgi:hypothetical protein
MKFQSHQGIAWRANPGDVLHVVRKSARKTTVTCAMQKPASEETETNLVYQMISMRAALMSSHSEKATELSWWNWMKASAMAGIWGGT